MWPFPCWPAGAKSVPVAAGRISSIVATVRRSALRASLSRAPKCRIKIPESADCFSRLVFYKSQGAEIPLFRTVVTQRQGAEAPIFAGIPEFGVLETAFRVVFQDRCIRPLCHLSRVSETPN